MAAIVKLGAAGQFVTGISLLEPVDLQHEQAPQLHNSLQHYQLVQLQRLPLEVIFEIVFINLKINSPRMRAI